MLLFLKKTCKINIVLWDFGVEVIATLVLLKEGFSKLEFQVNEKNTFPFLPKLTAEYMS